MAFGHLRGSSPLVWHSGQESISDQGVSVRQLTNRVLERETSQRVRFECEIAVDATELPDDVAALRVDFDDLTQVPHAHQVMPILGDVDRVGMREVQWRVLGELRQNEGIRGIDG